MAEIKYEVVQRIAVLSERPRGWERQLNLISWNDGEPKYDIRDWSPDGTRMGKGISLSHDELADRKSTRLNSSHTDSSRMPSSA